MEKREHAERGYSGLPSRSNMLGSCVTNNDKDETDMELNLPAHIESLGKRE